MYILAVIEMMAFISISQHPPNKYHCAVDILLPGTLFVNAKKIS